MKSFSIRQLCDEFGVTARALRFYEDRGLLSPDREGLNRIYSARDRARLRLILQGKRVGFNLVEVGEMLHLFDRSDGDGAQMSASLAKFRERVAALRVQRDDIDSAIQSLEEGCAWLEARLAEARPATLARAVDYDAMLRVRLDGSGAGTPGPAE